MTFSTHKINAIIFNYETFFICHENEKEGIVDGGYVFCGSEVHQKWFRIVVYKRGKWGSVNFWNGSKLIGFFMFIVVFVVCNASITYFMIVKKVHDKIVVNWAIGE